MSNDIRGEVEFEAFDKVWTVKLGNRAVRHVETVEGIPYPLVGEKLSSPETATISLITTVFHASLKHFHPDVTVEQCDEIIDELGYDRVGEILNQAGENTQRRAGASASARPRKAAAKSTGRR